MRGSNEDDDEEVALSPLKSEANADDYAPEYTIGSHVCSCFLRLVCCGHLSAGNDVAPWRVNQVLYFIYCCICCREVPCS